MTTERKHTPTARSIRERRNALRKSLRDLGNETGVHFARLSQIERGLVPSLAEHQAIEVALTRWEAAK